MEEKTITEKQFLYKNSTFEVYAKENVTKALKTTYISSCRFTIIFVADCRMLPKVVDVD